MNTKKVLYELVMVFYLLPLWLIMIAIDASMRGLKNLNYATGWGWTTGVYKFVHMCGEKLSRHIQKLIPR